jgi:hypothetical protein
MESYELKVELQVNSEYDKEPVYYCKRCLSLAIKSVGEYDYCTKCNCTEIGVTDIHTWLDMRKEKYGIEDD